MELLYLLHRKTEEEVVKIKKYIWRIVQNQKGIEFMLRNACQDLGHMSSDPSN